MMEQFETNTPHMEQIIIHCDMDSYYASVEMRDDPSLRGKPLIIGSLPRERGVVATCNYEARKYGVHSAMNIKEAYRLCPHGIYMHPNFEKYKGVSSQINEIWNEYATVSERIALDEAYLDVTEKAIDLNGAREIGLTIKRRVLEETGLTCSVGVAYSKTAAKMASEEKKPDGYFEIPTSRDFISLVIDRDVNVLYTVGKKTAEKLHEQGIRTVRDLQQRQNDVIRLLGKHGRWLTQISFGIDNRKVEPYRPEDAKSIGRELTFQTDVSDFELLKDVLFLLSLSVENRAKRVGLHGGGVTLKATYANMKSITRSKIVPFCESAVTIYSECCKLLDQIEKRPVRLIGASIYNLSADKTRQLSFDDYLNSGMYDRTAERDAYLQKLHERYGLDFAGHLEQLYRGETLHKTAEYMRKKRIAA